MFNPYKSSKKIKDEFVDYITTIFPFNNKEIKSVFNDELRSIIHKGPYLDIMPSFETRYSLRDLIHSDKDDKISPLFEDLEKDKINKDRTKYKIEYPLSRPLYSHQYDAIVKSKKGNLVVTTGTSSGKTDCFLLPILNELLHEKEVSGIISDRVKVILIYPMNALANDQMKRLRNILMFYPDIRFGSYTGETKESKDDAEKNYATLHEYEEIDELKCEEDHCGLKNEIKSRKEMRDRPPHILITNYAMLERMLLVPDNDVLFRTADMKYIVLDEAHVYQGARGMETSLLIRRLLARINSSNTKFILTSATLGEKGSSEQDICEFASNLTSGYFDKDCIIYGQRKTIQYNGLNQDIDIQFFEKVSQSIEQVQEISDIESDLINYCKEYNIDYNYEKPIRENIYDICFNSTYYKKLSMNFLSGKNLTINISELCKIIDVKNINEAVSFIYVASFGEKGGLSLLDSRYHFFLRALEGCFISFSKPNSIFLQRKLFDENNYRVFELSICKKCGDLAIYGKINEDGILVQQSGNYVDSGCSFFHFDSNIELNQIEDEDDDEISESDCISDEKYKDKKGSHKISKYYLCPKCGKITISTDGKPKCDCNVEHINLYAVGDDYSGCLICKNGKYNKFYIGNDAATGVIGTTLFEELPTKMKKENEGGMDVYKEAGKQFLVFSDSRSEAAYFSSYLDKTYEVFLRRRAITYVIENNKKLFIDKPWTLSELADKVSKLFYENRTFRKNVLDSGNDKELEQESKRNAWYGILTELAGQKKRNSLSSLGITCFEYGGLQEMVDHYSKHPTYSKIIDIQNAYALFNELVMTIAYWGAVEPDYKLTPEDRLFIFYSRQQKLITQAKDYTESEDAYKTRNISSWKPRVKKNKPNEFVKNSRYRIVSKLLNTDDNIEIGKFLDDVFKYLSVFISPSYRLKVVNNNQYFLPASAFVVKSPLSDDVKWFKCNKCGKISNYSINGMCMIDGCDGLVSQLNYEVVNGGDNHYRNMYMIDDFHKLFIKEHTAQISSNDAANYQSDFENNRLNALSCSTTFEMGVDLGKLETVFMRDVPPNPSNYTQRSGRAGRSKEASAYTITYAKLSSHDFNYFNKPLDMINGKILPPRFKINNEKVVLRHIFAVVLSYLFSHKIVEMNVKDFLSENNLENIRNFLNKKQLNEDLTEILRKSFYGIDCSGYEPTSYKWIDKFVGDFGVLTLLVNDFQDTLHNYTELINGDLSKASEEEDEMKKQIYIDAMSRHQKQKNGFLKVRLIDALSRGNVLPKYGFPVDNASLDIEDTSVDLSRDLSVAISEYAPGETVVANGKKYVSRYIKKKIVGKEKSKIFTERFFAICPNKDCQTYNYSRVEIGEDDFHACSGCGKPISPDKWERSIIPEEGFFHDRTQMGDVSIINKPEKLYTSEDCYVGDNKAIKETTYLLNKNTIKLKHTENDEIMVVSKTAFYVCPYCGFSYGKLDTIKDENGKKDNTAEKQRNIGNKSIYVKATHKNWSGKDCECHNFNKNYLTHVYKTDVVQISFDTPNASNKNTMISTMTALLDSMSDVLDIERTDLSGCIKLAVDKFDIILYDAVPGGAGHVKRLLDGDGKIISTIIQNAKKRMNCDCGSSCYKCLRNYYNQRVHDILNRFDVIDFLNNYIGEYRCISDNIKSDIIDINFDNKQEIFNGNFGDLIKDIKKEPDEIEWYNDLLGKCNKYKVDNPTYVNKIVEIKGKKYTFIAKWDDKKVILTDSKKLYEIAKNDSLYKVFLINDSDINELISSIRR